MRGLLLMLLAVPLCAEEVSICELMAAPLKYDGQTVTVRGIYLVGFEASRFDSNRCKDARMWIEFAPDFERNTDARVLKRWNRSFGPAANLPTCDNAKSFGVSSRLDVTFTGTFAGVKPTRTVLGHTWTQGFGHMSGYDAQLTVTSIARVGRKREQTTDWLDDPPGSFIISCSMANTFPI